MSELCCFARTSKSLMHLNLAGMCRTHRSHHGVKRSMQNLPSVIIQAHPRRVRAISVKSRVPTRRHVGRKTVVSNKSSDFHLGVLSDVQYADKPDKINSRGVTVGYRLTAVKLASAVDYFNSLFRQSKLGGVLHLGDIIDGNTTLEASRVDLQTVMNEFKRLEVSSIYHTVGNHCLAVSRSQLQQQLFPHAAMNLMYYSVKLSPTWRLVVLDTMDISKHPECNLPVEAADFLAKHPMDQFPQMGLGHGYANGGMGKVQVEWLKTTLSASDSAGERVIVAMHHPAVEGVALESHLLWNHQEVSTILTSSASVVAVFNGHYHPGGFCCHEDTYFVGFEGMVETQGEKNNAYAQVVLTKEHIEILGQGVTACRRLPFLKHLPGGAKR